MSRCAIIGFTLLALTLTGCGFFPRREAAAVHPERRELVEYVVASGQLRPVRRSDIGAETAGTVDRVLADEGDRVRAGQTLIVLRQGEMERQVEQARFALETTRRQLEQVRRGALPDEISRERAELDRRRSARELEEQDLERTRRLFEKNLVAKADLDRARSSLDQARASEQSGQHNLQVLLAQPRPEDLAVAEARVRESEAMLKVYQEQLQKRIITSPSDGLILKRKVEPGQSVIPGNSLMVLSITDRSEVYVETDENNLRKLRVGQKAIVVAPSFPDRPFRAVLTQIEPQVDYARGVVGLRFRPESLPDFARVDMTLDVSIEVARIRDALTLPATAVLQQDGKASVLKFRNDRLEATPVLIIGKGSERVAVSGLAAGDLVALRAVEVKAGDSVLPKENPQ
jgi:multidrug resistance efflux pump